MFLLVSLHLFIDHLFSVCNVYYDQIMQCDVCESSHTVSNSLLDSIINISGVDDSVRTVSDALPLMQHTHQVDAVMCEDCHNKTDHHKTLRFTSTGEFVVVRMNRQSYDPVTQLPLPKVTRFVKPDVNIRVCTNDTEYVIRAIACHSGDGYQSGHWTHVAPYKGVQTVSCWHHLSFCVPYLTALPSCTTGAWYFFSDDASPVLVGESLDNLEGFLLERRMTTDIFIYGVKLAG